MRTTRLTPGWFFVLLVVLSGVIPASGREKTDVVILKNGDHITCQVKTLARGMLTVATDSMGTVEIKWPDVERITSKFLFRLQDTKGQIYVGALQPAADERRVNVHGSQEGSNLDHLSIVQIQALEDSRWKRFSGSADLSYSFTKASERTQFNFSGDLMYRTERYTGQLDYSSTLGTSNGKTDSDRQDVTLVGTRQFSGKWVGYAQSSLEHNLELQLDRRYSFLGGPGYMVVRSNRSQITAIGAAAFTRESYYGEESGKSAEGFFGVDAQFFKLYSPKFDISSQFGFLPSFTTGGRRRLEFNTKVRLEVFRDFFVTLTFYDSYDSKPPSETGVSNDYGFTTGLSWSFRK